jgi:HAD superfamily hydrolase (TIGR01458 family)
MEVQGLLVDLDGTLYVGDEPVRGAREALERLGAAGVRVRRYVTNTTRNPRRVVREKLLNLGYGVEEGEIFTPAVAAAGLLGGRSCLPLVDDSLLADLTSIDFGTEDVDYVLVGDLGEGFTYGRLDGAFRALMDGAGLVALQKNRYWRTPEGLSLDAGPFVAALEFASGKTATVVGKPKEAFFRLALDDLGLEPEVVAMVGDDPVADVAGARTAGLKGVAVETGKHGGQWDADLVLGSIAELPGALGIE